MLKTLTSAGGLVLLVSSFALAGQTPTKPTEPPKVTTPSQQQTNQTGKTKHHKHHKKQHAPTTQPAAPKQ